MVVRIPISVTLPVTIAIATAISISVTRQPTHFQAIEYDIQLAEIPLFIQVFYQFQIELRCSVVTYNVQRSISKWRQQTCVSNRTYRSSVNNDIVKRSS